MATSGGHSQRAGAPLTECNGKTEQLKGGGEVADTRTETTDSKLATLAREARAVADKHSAPQYKFDREATHKDAESIIKLAIQSLRKCSPAELQASAIKSAGKARVLYGTEVEGKKPLRAVRELVLSIRTLTAATALASFVDINDSFEESSTDCLLANNSFQLLLRLELCRQTKPAGEAKFELGDSVGAVISDWAARVHMLSMRHPQWCEYYMDFLKPVYGKVCSDFEAELPLAFGHRPAAQPTPIKNQLPPLLDEDGAVTSKRDWRQEGENREPSAKPQAAAQQKPHQKTTKQPLGRAGSGQLAASMRTIKRVRGCRPVGRVDLQGSPGGASAGSACHDGAGSGHNWSRDGGSKETGSQGGMSRAGSGVMGKRHVRQRHPRPGIPQRATRDAKRILAHQCRAMAEEKGEPAGMAPPPPVWIKENLAAQRDCWWHPSSPEVGGPTPLVRGTDKKARPPPQPFFKGRHLDFDSAEMLAVEDHTAQGSGPPPFRGGSRLQRVVVKQPKQSVFSYPERFIVRSPMPTVVRQPEEKEKAETPLVHRVQRQQPGERGHSPTDAVTVPEATAASPMEEVEQSAPSSVTGPMVSFLSCVPDTPYATELPTPMSRGRRSEETTGDTEPIVEQRPSADIFAFPTSPVAVPVPPNAVPKPASPTPVVAQSQEVPARIRRFTTKPLAARTLQLPDAKPPPPAAQRRVRQVARKTTGGVVEKLDPEPSSQLQPADVPAQTLQVGERAGWPTEVPAQPNFGTSPVEPSAASRIAEGTDARLWLQAVMKQSASQCQPEAPARAPSARIAKRKAHEEDDVAADAQQMQLDEEAEAKKPASKRARKPAAGAIELPPTASEAVRRSSRRRKAPKAADESSDGPALPHADGSRTRGAATRSKRLEPEKLAAAVPRKRARATKKAK